MKMRFENDHNPRMRLQRRLDGERCSSSQADCDSFVIPTLENEDTNVIERPLFSRPHPADGQPVSNGLD